nr:hypothetical protein [Tanacetum cinerariifolium]
MGTIDINALTIEQYIALTRRDRTYMVIPELGNDVDFEIKSQFMSELKCNLFACCKIYEEVHLTEERPVKEDREVGEQVKYIRLLEETINRFMEELTKKQYALDERIRKFRDDTDMSFRMLDAATKNMQGKSEQLT